jgi:putative ABC transport system substrate-binding protein
MVTDILTLLNRKRVFDFAAANRVPAIYEFDFLVRDGGLMSYGPDGKEVTARVADLVSRILKGEAGRSAVRTTDAFPLRRQSQDR